MPEKKPKHEVRIRRVQDEAGSDDGTRVLVDRLWPRGLAKSDAAFDEWLKDAAPSAELRKWYGHDPAKYEEFAGRYRAELADPEPATADALERLGALAADGTLTLLTATKHPSYSHVPVLAAEVAETGAGTGRGADHGPR